MNKFFSENFLITKKTFRIAANNLGDLNMIYQRLSETFLCLEKGFPNSFKTTVVAFQHGFQPIRTPKNLGKPLINLLEFSKKFKFSERVSPEPQENFFLWSKIVGASEKFLKQRRFSFRPRPIHICQKTELKSRWTVPLSSIAM